MKAKPYWQSFRENLTVTVTLFLLTLWQASMRLEGILQPNFSIMFATFSSRTSASPLLGVPIMSIHYRLEY